MLCHTPCNRGPVWSEQWPLPHLKSATAQRRLRASLHWVFNTLMCFLMERCESCYSPGNFVDPSTGRVGVGSGGGGGVMWRDGDILCWPSKLTKDKSVTKYKYFSLRANVFWKIWMAFDKMNETGKVNRIWVIYNCYLPLISQIEHFCTSEFVMLENKTMGISHS